MQRKVSKTVLFLCADGDQRGDAAVTALDAVAAKMGLPFRGRRLGASQAAEADFDGAALVVAPDEEGCRPLLEERFPTRVGAVRFWRIPSGAMAPSAIESEVMGLVAVLLGGKAEAPVAPTATEPPKKKQAELPVVRVGRETKGRRGKGVTTVFDLPLSAAEIEKLAARLKQKCGTGGTVKDGVIEIQGDHRDRLVGELESLGYRVKRAGG